MFDALYRQRRRLILIALLTCLPFSAMVVWSAFITLGYLPIDRLLTDRYMFISFYIVYSLVISAVNAAILLIPASIIVFAPRFRGLIEVLIMGVVCGLLLTWIIHVLGIYETLGSFEAPLILGLVFALFYFRVLDRILPRMRYKATATFISDKSANLLWAELVPATGTIDQHWHPALQAITDDADTPNTRMATYNFPKATLQQTMQITDNRAPQHFAYRYDNAPIKKITPPGGSYSIFIEDKEFARQVTLQMTTDKLPFTHWLNMWLGDILRDQTDHLVAIETGKRDYSLTKASFRGITGAQTGSISPSARPA